MKRIVWKTDGPDYEASLGDKWVCLYWQCRNTFKIARTVKINGDLVSLPDYKRRYRNTKEGVAAGKRFAEKWLRKP